MKNTKKFRFWNRVVAFFGGYFWMPCPMCGEYFGGHEVTEKNKTYFLGYGYGKTCCADCPGTKEPPRPQ